MRSLVMAVLLLCVSPLLRADGELPSLLTSADKTRLGGLDATREDALAAARSGGDAADVGVLDAALAGDALPFDERFDPAGEWRCRVIKTGGTVPLVVYGWFRCRISDDGAGWMLHKLSGSQRTQGRFYTQDDTRLVYVGAGFIAGESASKYGKDPGRDQVAIATRRAEKRLVLEFPRPAVESLLDVMVLER
jgi:hypothetical protein